MSRSAYAVAGRAAPRMALSACLCSWTAAILLALIVGIYWPLYAYRSDLAILMLRPSVIVAAVLLAMWNTRRLSRAETRLAGFLMLMCAVLLAPVLTATVPSRAAADWIKLAVLCLASILVSRALRDKGTATAFGYSLILASILAAILMLQSYVGVMGWSMPTYETSRALKGIELRANVPLNSIAFTCVFSYVCGMCLVRGGAITWLLGCCLFPLASVLTGSRAPLAIMIASGFLLLLLNGAVSGRPAVRLVTWLAIGGVVALSLVGVATLSFKDMSTATEGRWDLWSIAVQKAAERPWLGFGFDSWRDDLVTRLPGDYAMTSEVAAKFEGGYHNEYLTALAEQGVVGFLAVMALFVFVLRSSAALAFRHLYTWRNGQWALFGCLFLMLRAAVEAPGLFGYGQEPADYLAFFFVAIVVSRFSVEEDHLQIALRPEYPDSRWNYAHANR
jgi:O-antigen ligase